MRQRTTSGISAVAFAAVERTSSINRNPDTPSGDDSNNAAVVLHCVGRDGTVFEASTGGAVWNAERDGGDGHAEVPAGGAAAAARLGWHMCADLEALLLVSPEYRIYIAHPSRRRSSGVSGT